MLLHFSLICLIPFIITENACNKNQIQVGKYIFIYLNVKLLLLIFVYLFSILFIYLFSPILQNFCLSLIPSKILKF